MSLFKCNFRSETRNIKKSIKRLKNHFKIRILAIYFLNCLTKLLHNNDNNETSNNDFQFKMKRLNLFIKNVIFTRNYLIKSLSQVLDVRNTINHSMT